METLKALGLIYHKLELRDKERRFGITMGLVPELDAYFKILGLWHAVHRSPETQRGIDPQSQELFKNFYLIVEVCVLKYGEKGHTVFNGVSDFLRSLKLDDSLQQAAGDFIKFRVNGQFRVIE